MLLKKEKIQKKKKRKIRKVTVGHLKGKKK